MSTLILRPIWDGDHIGIENVDGVSAHWDAVNDDSPDNSSTYISTSGNTSNYYYDLYRIASPLSTISQVYKINSIKIYFRVAMWAGGNGVVKPVFKTGGTEYIGTEISVPNTTWTTNSQTWTTHPGTGQAWRWQDIVDMQIGIYLKTLAYGYGCCCTQVYLEIDYDSSAAFPISSVTFRPSSAGDVTTLDYSTPANHWDAVNDTSPDDASTYIWGNTPGTYKYDLYGVDVSEFNPCQILGILITFRISTNLNSPGYAKPAIKIAGSTYYGYEIYHTSSTWTAFSQFFAGINPSTGNPWTWDDVRAMQIGIALKSVNTGDPIKCTQVYATVYYYPIAGRPRAQIIGF